MGLGVSLFLIAIGLILWLAVSAEVSGIDINMVGLILVIIGALGLLISMIFWSTWGGVGGWRRDTVVRDDRYDRPPY
ncbi:MAG TPA: DUF6458 family protein [Gaiellaceae bacterium]|nr:DUF6458 family protein [Gaiellaceae bacterium]